MYSLRFTVILLVVLVVPLLMRWRGYEPYPAVMLPSGAGVIKIAGKNVDVRSKVILGRKPSGKWESIEARSFLKPVSVQNFVPLLDANFGLKGNKDAINYGNSQFLIKILNLKRKPPNEHDLRAIKQWLNTRLILQGYAPDQIKIVTYINTISTTKGIVISKKTLNEKIVAFDK